MLFRIKAAPGSVEIAGAVGLRLLLLIIIIIIVIARLKSAAFIRLRDGGLEELVNTDFVIKWER